LIKYCKMKAGQMKLPFVEEYDLEKRKKMVMNV
jgi:hypothetical protein